jgi:hypothetical protein
MYFGLALAAVAFIELASGQALASTIYNVDLGSGGTSAKGTITTDSSLGTLSTANILDWHILLDTGTETFSLNGTSNSYAQANGSGPTATASGLFFNFSKTDFSFLIFQDITGSGINYLCFNDATGVCSSNPSLVAVFATSSGATFSIGSGNELIASAGVVPLPATFPLLASALGGLGLVACKRRTSAQVAA